MRMDAHATMDAVATTHGFRACSTGAWRGFYRVIGVILLVCLSAASPAWGQDIPTPASAATPSAVPTAPGAASSGTPAGQSAAGTQTGAWQLPDLSNRQTFSSAMQIIILLTILSLAPAILIMMTSFTRIIIVLSLLRQALGAQSLPPNQVLIGLALFMTFVVMTPTWNKLNADALAPYLNGTIDQRTALENAQGPLRDFMIRQIEAAGNDSDVDVFTDFQNKPRAQTWDQVSTITLIPAFMLSELKTAFLLGFKVYLPFLVIDLVISAVLISMGMMMLPPTLISLPFKLLLFVLVNGWHLVVSGLLGSFAH